MRPFVRAGSAFILYGLVFLRGPAAAYQTPARTDAQWLQDLQYFADHLSSGQKDFATVYPPDRFDHELNDIRQHLPQLSNHEIKLRLMRLVASAHIVHNSVDIPGGFERLPLMFYWYSDGLVVTAAAQEYREAIGARVVRVGAMTPEQLEGAVAPYVSHENQAWLHEASPVYMRLVDVLHELHIDGPDGHVTLTLAKPDGRTFELSVALGAAPETLITAEDALQIPARVALGRNLSSYYWYTYLPESRTLYIQYNRCGNDPAQSFSAFTSAMFATIASRPIERTIVDLRFNAGGNNSVVAPLERGLKERPALSARGHLYTLIGRSTVSSGMDAATDFRDRLHAILIGEPLGEKPNTYGEVKNFTLPNSGLVVRYSTKFFRTEKDSDPVIFEPDIVVTRSIEDFLAGRDPVLDAALQHPLR